MDIPNLRAANYLRTFILFEQTKGNCNAHSVAWLRGMRLGRNYLLEIGQQRGGRNYFTSAVNDEIGSQGFQVPRGAAIANEGKATKLQAQLSTRDPTRTVSWGKISGGHPAAFHTESGIQLDGGLDGLMRWLNLATLALVHLRWRATTVDRGAWTEVEGAVGHFVATAISGTDFHLFDSEVGHFSADWTRAEELVDAWWLDRDLDLQARGRIIWDVADVTYT